MPHPKVKLSDDSGNTVAVTDNKLDINIASDTSETRATNAGIMNPTTLRMTLATDDSHFGTVGTGAAVDGTLHAQMSYSGGKLNDIAALFQNVVGTSTVTGPTNCLSIAGTQSGGVLKELLVDSDGNLQIDVVSAPSTAVTNAGTFAMQVDGDALTALQLIDDAVYVDDADWTDGSSKHLLVGGLYQSSMQSVTDGDVAPFQVTNKGVLKVEIDPTVTEGTTAAFHAVGGPYNVSNRIVYIENAVRTDTSPSALGNVGDGDWTALQVNADGALYVEVVTSTALTVDLGSNNDVTVTSGSVGHDITGMVSGNNTDVGTSAEILRTLGNVACKRVDIMAAVANTGVIYVGGSNLTATNGIALNPGDFYSVDVDGTSDVYLLAAEDGEDVSFTYYT